MIEVQFQLRHHNRLMFPRKHIVVAEDDIFHQVELLTHLSNMFDRQGLVRISIVAGGAAVAAIIKTEPVDLLILDFDMPYGNSADLIAWMKANEVKIPVITASGWEPNLAVMKTLLEEAQIEHKIFSKQQVIIGDADDWIRELMAMTK